MVNSMLQVPILVILVGKFDTSGVGTMGESHNELLVNNVFTSYDEFGMVFLLELHSFFQWFIFSL